MDKLFVNAFSGKEPIVGVGAYWNDMESIRRPSTFFF